MKRRLRDVVAMVMVAGMAAAACSGSGGDHTATSGPGTTRPGPSGGGGAAGTSAASRLFGVRLSEGTAAVTQTAATQVVTGTDLPADAIAAVLARLPDWAGGTSEQESFNWPVQGLLPPRTGATIDVPFPPADNPPAETVPTGPLHVVRVQPEGDTPIAPYVAVTFDQPMVAVGTVAQVDAADVPVKLSPAVDGHWQWIGTRTLRFDANAAGVDRLPMATEFTVTVPTGTTSATGGVLAADATFRFVTPPPTVTGLTPTGESMPRQPIWVAVFDQRVDPSAVLATVHVGAGAGDVTLRLATAAEVAADEGATAASQAAEPGRWVAFTPAEPLPTDTAVTIVVGPGTPSAEGPRQTTAAQAFDGRTYPSLRVIAASCSWEPTCPPGSPISIQFSNPLDTVATDPSSVVVSPALAGLSAGISGDTILIQGATQARTEYTVTLPAGITDVFGQTLGESTTRTVTIGSALPSITQYPMVTTLDPFETGRRLTIDTVQHDALRVRVFAADPSMYGGYVDYANRRDEPQVSLPGWKVLSDRQVSAGAGDGITSTPIDLAKELDASHGHVIVLVESMPPVSASSDSYWNNRPALTWVQSTRLGVDTVADGRRSKVWVTDLRTGAPVGGVSVKISDGDAMATTGTDGVATLDLPAQGSENQLLLATLGDDTAILPGYLDASPTMDTLRWMVFDDRQMYRPGESMRVKGWVRRLTLASDATLHRPAAGSRVDYTVTDSYGNEVASGTADVGPLGGFDLDIAIPDNANLGYANVHLDLGGQSAIDRSGTDHSFQIQQFRTPEFEVTTQPESQPPFVSTNPVTVKATGAYYAGGPLAAAGVDWTVSTSTATYSPAGWDGFTFGIWQPWWLEGGVYGPVYRGGIAIDGPCCGPIGATDVKEYHGVTDASGNHYLQVDFVGKDGTLPDLPVTVSAQATITDVNRQAWADTTNLLVHSSERYVGLRSSRAFVRQGDTVDVDVVVTDVDGTATPGSTLTVTAGRLDQVWADGKWAEKVVDESSCEVTSAADPVPCSFPAPLGGQYRVTAVVTDAQGGRNRTELTVYVSGAGSQPTSQVDEQMLTVVPDKASYAPGDTAELLVQSPFATGEGLLTVSRNGIERIERFTVADGSAVLRIPISEDSVPSLSVSVEVVGAAARLGADGRPVDGGPLRPAYATGGLALPVSLASRTLTVTATPHDANVAPGAHTSVDVKVAGPDGAPVQGAEFAVMVVDEAVLALSGYTLPDPLSAFYGDLGGWVSTNYGRALVRLLTPDLLRDEGSKDMTTATAADSVSTAAGTPAPTMAGSAASSDAYRQTAGEAAPPIDVRSSFDALALFEPSVTTGADGTASVPFTLPGNLTRYRVMVVAVDGDQRFGSAASDLTARLPLMVRPSAPRFANFGDRFELPVVVQNQTATDVEADVVLQTGNLAPAEPQGRAVTVPANGRVEVRFPVSTEEAGTAAFRVAVSSGDMADAATGELPVFTPATAEAFATYGVIDDGGVVQPVTAPTGVVPQFGGMEITTSSTALQALTDAVLYVSTYPYDSVDAAASQIIAIGSLRDVLDAFDAAGMPTPAALDAAMSKAIGRLVSLQNDDGTWGWWERYAEPSPYVTVQATHALLVAKAAGLSVPQNTLDTALAALANIESYIPATYGDAERDTISAYALWVRRLAGEADTAKAADLFSRRHDQLQPDALAWLWGSLQGADHDEVERLLRNRVVETAGEANITTSYTDSAYTIMNSDRRVDGVVLDALIGEQPDSDLIPKLVAGLLGHRTKGHWDDIQENSFILLALHRYFETYEGQDPQFVARVWLGDRFAGEHQFEGRQTDRVNMDIPMSDLAGGGDTALTLTKDGGGRLYYRIGLRYAPADLALQPLDRGFVVARRYEALDDPSDVSRDADGTWHVKAGARVRVTLTMVAEGQRTQVALVDPMPAGFEALNPALATTQTVPPVDGDGATQPLDRWSWWGPWYEHQQLRDDRAEAFAFLLPAGTYTYSYVARATTPGSFVAPPARAEQIYAPETFGRSATDTVVVG